MSNNKYDEKCRLLIIGDSFVGKTSFLSYYSNGNFNLHYLATAGLELITKDEIIDNKTIRIDLWDTAGNEKFHSLTTGFFKNAEGIMVMFDVTTLTSFENVRNWTESIKTHLSLEANNIPVIIIGNKIDLKEREIKTEDANKYCRELGFKYFETSAKTGENVDLTVKYLVKEVIKKKQFKINDIIIPPGNKDPNGKKHKKEDGCICQII